jgi:predicted DNA-binding protein (MmcQ/YjbR family)
MQFTKRLRDGVRSGKITCSIRIWQRPSVKPGGCYRMQEGQIEVDSIVAIELEDVTPELARESGFDGVVDLLKTAKHGPGTNVYLVRFHYLPPGKVAPKRAVGSLARRPASGKPGSTRQRARVVRIVEQLPEAEAIASGTHLSLEVRKKRFGYFLDDHHGDGRLALHCKSSPDVSEALLELAPEQVHTPKYLGNKGWIGLWLDGTVHWEAVEIAIREAYALVAPKLLKGGVAQRSHR